MLLAAGFGTRLGALSEDRPKPMLPVCDLPILQYGVSLLVGHGITDIVINVHHRADSVERALGDGSRLGARIRYSREATILGTGGGLKNALPLLDPNGHDEPFLSLNGKLIFDVDLHAITSAYERAGEPLGLLVVRAVPDAASWGAVRCVPSGDGLRVEDILGEGAHMFTGVHMTRPSVVARLPEGEACMVRQGYLPWLRQGGYVAACEAGGYFAEHSTPERYLASNLELLAGEPLRFPPGPLRGVAQTAVVAASARLVEPVRVGPGARIGHGATVGPGVVVGSGAAIADNVQIERAVVWPGARVEASVADAIVTPKVTLNV